jgi:hypothetical protein
MFAFLLLIERNLKKEKPSKARLMEWENLKKSQTHFFVR